jgi:hypothetical protein
MILDSRLRSGRMNRLGRFSLLLIFVTAVFPWFVGCGEDENPLGFDRGPAAGNFARPETLRIDAPAADIQQRPLRETSSALSILVGSDSTAAMKGLIKFGSIPDTSGMTVAYVRLHYRRGQGEPVTLAIRQVLGGSDSWTASTVVWDTPLETSDVIAERESVPTGTVTASYSQLKDIPIPWEIIRGWYRDQDTNAGLLLETTAGNGIARFVSHNDVILDSNGYVVYTPLLILATDSTATTTRSARATVDAYVYQSHRPVPGPNDETSFIGSGPPIRTLMRFDLASLPREISIVNATLSVPQFTSGIDSARVSVYNILDEWSESSVPDSLTLASLPVDSRYFDGSPTALTLDVGALVQAWVDGKATNRGFAMRYADELGPKQGAPWTLRVATRDYHDPAQRPSLQIVYLRAITTPPWGGRP